MNNTARQQYSNTVDLLEEFRRECDAENMDKELVQKTAKVVARLPQYQYMNISAIDLYDYWLGVN
jgi:hypothetical protein